MGLSKQVWQSEQVSIRYRVHEFMMSDVEDPDLWAAQSLHEFEQSEKGKWVMANSKPTASWHRHVDHMIYGYKYYIQAYLTPKQLTYYKLKFE